MGLDTVEINEETGFPVVPDNYIWRVLNEGGANRYFTVQLIRIDIVTKQRPKYIFWTEEYTTRKEVRLREEYVDTYQLVFNRRTKEAVSHLIQVEAKKLWGEWLRSSAQRDMMNDLSGDYPPKKLTV